MKNLFFTVLLFSAPIFTFAAESENKTDDMKLESLSKKMFHVNILLTSADGCKFRIVGEVEVSWTGAFQSFKGTVTAWGPDDCPNGNWTFGMVVDDSGGEEPIDIKMIRFAGDNPFIDILKLEPETLTELIRLFESQA